MLKKSYFIVAIFSLFLPTAGLLADENFVQPVVSSDPFTAKQTYLQQIRAPQAWASITQAPEEIVAVIDSGVDVENYDLSYNIWVNPKEVAGDGLDNDNNGYIDDVNGWDFINNVPDPRPKITKNYSKLAVNHGTIVSGIIGAVGNNNFGLAGILWKVKIMPLKVIDEQGNGNGREVGLAIKYAADNGADIINLSLVGAEFDTELEQAVAYAHSKGLAIVAAAGNESSLEYPGIDTSYNLALHPQYPVCYDGPEGENYILGVGAVNLQDKKSIFSGFGTSCVDLYAPGENFYGLLFFSPTLHDFQKSYGGYWSGTSLAAPQVSAALAMIKALRPDLNFNEIYNLLLANTDDLDQLNPEFKGLLGRGRLNLEKAVAAALSDKSLGGNFIIAPASQKEPLIQFMDEKGQSHFSFLAYDKKFRGGVNLAVADLNNDNIKEIITAPGSGGGPQIKIFNVEGKLQSQFFAYPKSFLGGVNVAVGDVDGDGEDEIITAPQSYYQPLVKIFDLTGKLKIQFLAYAKSFTGGVNLALGDINADNILEIYTAPQAGIRAEIKTFDSRARLINSFLAYDKKYYGGASIAAGDLFLDARSEIIVSPLKDALKQPVKIFSPEGNLDYEWLVAGAKNGYKAAIYQLNKYYEPTIVLSPVKGRAGEVKILGYRGKELGSFSVFGTNFYGGINLVIK